MSVVASLVSGQSPQLVQIVLDDIPVGVSWRLTGHVGDLTLGLLPGSGLVPGVGVVPADSVFESAGYSWAVPGGSGVGDGGQVVLVDNRSPGNVPFIYRLTTDVGVESSGSVMVPFSSDIVLQTLDGQATVDLDLMAGSLGMAWEPAVASFRVPGRRRPVVRYDVLGDGGSAFVLKVPFSATADLRRVLTSGAPIVYRFGDTSFDLDPVGVVSVRSVESEAFPTADMRMWTLGYELIDDPFVDVRLGAFTWDSGFDAAFVDRPWNEFDSAFVGLDWDAFDQVDWEVA